MSITRPTLLAWRQAGLVPPPQFRSLGRGHGSAQLWPALSYRRLLQVNRLRSQGNTSHRLQRLHLWLQGNQGDVAQVRRDLEAVYRQMIRQVHSEMGTESWSWAAPERQPSSKRTTQMAMALIQEVGPLHSGVGMESGVVPTPLLSLAETLRRAAAAPLVRSWVHALLLPATGTFRNSLRTAFERLPEQWREFLPAGTLPLVEATIGLVADPELGPQPLLEALGQCPDQILLDLRDATRGWNDFWFGVLTLARRLASQHRDNPESALAGLAGRLEMALAWLTQYRPVKTSADALVVLALLLLLRDRQVLASERLGHFARAQGGRQLFGWMALHLEELQEAAGGPPGTLLGVPAVLPPAQRTLWQLAHSE